MLEPLKFYCIYTLFPPVDFNSVGCLGVTHNNINDSLTISASLIESTLLISKSHSTTVGATETNQIMLFILSCKESQKKIISQTN